MIADPFPTHGIDFYRDKRVCVLGATGLIGQYVVKMLAESHAHPIRVVYHKRQPPQYIGDSECSADLMIADHATQIVRGYEIVVNCAGITGGIGIVKEDPVSYVGPATAMACNVIHACHVTGVERMGFLSSTTVYVPGDYAVTEDDFNEKGNWEWPPYKLYEGIAYSKRFLENLCRYYHERVGLKVAVVRPAGAYGRYDNFREETSHVIPGMIQRAMRIGSPPGFTGERASPVMQSEYEKLSGNDTFEVWGDGTDVRDFIHAQDVARGFLLAIAKAPDATPINLASGKGTTTLDLAEVVLQAVGSKAAIKLAPEKPTALKKRLVDVRRAKEMLGFEAEIDLEAGIEDTMNWVKSLKK